MSHKCVVKDSCMHRKWEAHKCWTCAGRLAAPYHSIAFVCSFRVSIVIASSCSTQFLHWSFLPGTHLWQQVLSPTFCPTQHVYQLAMINSLKRRLPRSLFWIEGDLSLHSSLFYCSYRSYFFPSLPFFRQIMLPGAVSLAQQAKALFYLRFLYYCCPKLEPKAAHQYFYWTKLKYTYIYTHIHVFIYGKAGISSFWIHQHEPL